MKTLILTINKIKKLQNVIGPTYQIASSYEPVHNAFDLSIRVNPPKPELSSKLTIVRFDPDKEKIISEKSVYKDGWLSAQPQYLWILCGNDWYSEAIDHFNWLHTQFEKQDTIFDEHQRRT